MAILSTVALVLIDLYRIYKLTKEFILNQNTVAEATMEAPCRPLTILVTGSKSGLGMAIANALQDSGHTVIDYDMKDGNNVQVPFHNMVKPANLDVLINCAGINHNEWFEDADASLPELMGVNAFGIVRMTQALLPQLKASRGAVINIVSNAATIPMTSSLAYNMSKAAALMATKQMAHELTKKYGITVMSVSPNKLAGTAMSRQIEENICKIRGWTPEFAANYQKQALMHGLETPPEAVAEVIANLINSGNLIYMSGCDVPVGK